MSLPLIPGQCFDRKVGKERFHKSHYFDNKNDIRFSFGIDKVGIGGDPLPGQRIDPPSSVYPGMNNTTRSPAWVAFDKQVLSFDAYYQEAVTESQLEQFRIRNCKILFYLEDDTIQVIEPRIRNSGLPQGTIIKRHRISKKEPDSHLYYTVHDFNVGIDISLYDKVFRIVSCDIFTENFLRKLGVRIGHPEKVPEDQYFVLRKALAESMQPLRPYERKDTLKQFLDHDRHVLRFFCFWDDTDSLYGDPREMILHYFLSDDTIEVREIIPVNAGRDAAPSFLRRQKLPKKLEPLPEVGTITERIILNVLGHPQRGGRYVLDSLKTGEKKIDFYTDADLTIGSYINLYGRKFVICSMDEFTKEYYRTKYGIQTFNDIRYSMNKGVPIIHPDPPYNGWGTEEDSLANCHSLMLQPAKKDFVRFMEKDRKGLESNVLRFKARLITDKPLDADRRFIISYFLTDDSILIFEPKVRNSGFAGGQFLERGKIKKPGQERYSTGLPQYYQCQDMYIGAIISINTFEFLIEDADEYAYRYMETHPHEFEHSSIDRILDKMRPKAVGKRSEMMSYFQRQDPNSQGTVNFNQLTCLLRQMYSKSELTDHEICILARHYAFRPITDINIPIILGVAQQELRKISFEDFDALKEACLRSDLNRRGYLSGEEIRSICKVLHFPFPEGLLNALFEISQKADNGQICYEDFVWNLNWRLNPHQAPCEPDLPIELAYQWSSFEKKPIGRQIDEIFYEKLATDLTPAKIGGGSSAQCTPVSEDRPY